MQWANKFFEEVFKMKKFFMATILIFGIIAGHISAEAASNVRYYSEWKCIYCDKIIHYDGSILDAANRPDKYSYGSGKCAYAPVHIWHRTVYKDWWYDGNNWKPGNSIQDPLEDRAVREAKSKEESAKFEAEQKIKKEKAKAEFAAEREKIQQADAASSETIKLAAEKYKSKDYETSKSLYTKAIQINPYDGDLHYRLAKCYLRDKKTDYNKVIQEVTLAIQTRQKYYAGKRTKGVVGYSKEDFLALSEYYGTLADMYQRLNLKNLLNSSANYAALMQQARAKSNEYKAKANGQFTNQSNQISNRDQMVSKILGNRPGYRRGSKRY